MKRGRFDLSQVAEEGAPQLHEMHNVQLPCQILDSADVELEKEHDWSASGRPCAQWAEAA